MAFPSLVGSGLDTLHRLLVPYPPIHGTISYITAPSAGKISRTIYMQNFQTVARLRCCKWRKGSHLRPESAQEVRFRYRQNRCAVIQTCPFPY